MKPLLKKYYSISLGLKKLKINVQLAKHEDFRRGCLYIY